MSNNEKRPTVMYIHGYGSDGNAMKGQLLRKILPEWRVVSPTFDYDHSTPWEIQRQIAAVVDAEGVDMMVGSSFGGYHALCCASSFRGVIWAVNPVRDVLSTIRLIAGDRPEAEHFAALYANFDQLVFQPLVHHAGDGVGRVSAPLYFALSRDDELLGDHAPLLQLFPHHKEVIWKDHSGHHFLRFEELEHPIRHSLGLE